MDILHEQTIINLNQKSYINPLSSCVILHFFKFEKYNFNFFLYFSNDFTEVCLSKNVLFINCHADVDTNVVSLHCHMLSLEMLKFDWGEVWCGEAGWDMDTLADGQRHGHYTTGYFALCPKPGHRQPELSVMDYHCMYPHCIPPSGCPTKINFLKKSTLLRSWKLCLAQT